MVGMRDKPELRLAVIAEAEVPGSIRESGGGKDWDMKAAEEAGGHGCMDCRITWFCSTCTHGVPNESCDQCHLPQGVGNIRLAVKPQQQQSGGGLRYVT